MANDLINHVYAKDLHKNLKGMGSESSQVGEHMEVVGEGMKVLLSFFIP